MMNLMGDAEVRQVGYRTPVKYGDSIRLESWEGFPEQVTVTQSSSYLGEDRTLGAGARAQQELRLRRQERSGWPWPTAREESIGTRLI